MFIPIWLVHTIVSVMFLIGLCWAFKPQEDYDFGVVFRLFLVVILYLIYWVVMLACGVK